MPVPRYVDFFGATPRLLVIGGASLDVLHVGGEPVASPGGAGLYTALAAARAGAEVTMLAPLPDPMPEVLAPALDHIRWIGPLVPPDRLPRFEIAYGPGGEVTRFDSFFGAEPDMTPDLLDGISDMPAWVFCVPFLDAGLQLDFVREVRRRGRVAVAGTYGRAVRSERDTVRHTLAESDVFFCNEDEAAVLFGSFDRASVDAGKLLFVTRGARGARILQGGHPTDIAAPVVEAVDPTGAGDTFCGTTVVRLAAGDHPVEAARAAVAAASEVVAAVGPAVLFGSPGGRVATDDRVAVDPERVVSLGSLIGGLDDLDPFSFTGDFFPAPGDPVALDFFFAATLQQFGFWREDGVGWSEPMVARMEQQELKGSDFLWAAYRRWARRDPAGLTPAGQRNLTPASFSVRMEDDRGEDPLPASPAAAALAAGYGRTMTDLGWTADSVVDRAATSTRPTAALLGLLDHVAGYREDPLRKKSALLAVILRQRPERWLPHAGGDEPPPIVDYHVQRTCLRTGMIEVVDADLRARIEARRLLSAEDEEVVRRASFAAVEALVRASGRSAGTVDWFLFSMRTRCPETGQPDCDRCSAQPACARRIDLFQPVRRTTFY